MCKLYCLKNNYNLETYLETNPGSLQRFYFTFLFWQHCRSQRLLLDTTLSNFIDCLIEQLNWTVMFCMYSEDSICCACTTQDKRLLMSIYCNVDGIVVRALHVQKLK